MFLFISVALLWTRNCRRWRKGNGGGGWWLGVLGGVMGRSALLIRQPLSRDCRSLVHSSSLSPSLFEAPSLSYVHCLVMRWKISRNCILLIMPAMHICAYEYGTQKCPASLAVCEIFGSMYFMVKVPRIPKHRKISPSRCQFFFFFNFIFRLGPISLYLYTRSRPWECVSVLF